MGSSTLRIAVGVVLSTALLASAQFIQTGTSYNPVGSGARAMGQGNAFIAVADDATASSWNPAGIAQLEKPECSLAIEGLSSRGHSESDFQPETEGVSTMDVQDLNYASVVYPILAEPNLVLALDYLKLYRFERRFSAPVYIDDPATFLTTDTWFALEQEGSLAVLAPTLAANVTDRLSLGLALNIWNDEITQSSAFTKQERESGTANMFGFDMTYHSVTDNRFEVDHGYSLVLGALYRFSKEWTAGAVVKPEYRLEMDHTWRNVYTQESLALGDVPRTRVEAESDADIRFPWVVGVGVAWRPSDPLTVSFDTTWTDWSKFDFRENHLHTNPLTNQPSSRDRCDDTVTCRLGSEYLVIRDRYVWPLRAGVGYDPGPAVGQVDEYYTVSLGTGLQMGRFAWDIGYELRWGNGVNGSVFSPAWGSNEDVLQHRVLTSLIVYF
jgi:long-subunit fatty acid transport protein